MSRAKSWSLGDSRIYNVHITNERTGLPHVATSSAEVKALIKSYDKKSVLVAVETMTYNDSWLLGTYPVGFDSATELAVGTADLGQAYLEMQIKESGEAAYTADILLTLNKGLIG